MEYFSLDDGEDVEDIGVGLVEISVGICDAG